MSGTRFTLETDCKARASRPRALISSGTLTDECAMLVTLPRHR
jgi:hypothetical protein